MSYMVYKIKNCLLCLRIVKSINKRPMGHMAYLNNTSNNKINFKESYTNYKNNVVKCIP